MSKKNAAGTVSFIFIAIMLAKVLGMVREIVIAAVYGTSAEANAYVLASQIPVNFFDMILGSAISSAFIPVYNKFIQKENEKRANLFATRFLNFVMLITVILSVIGICFAPTIISVFSSEKMGAQTQAMAAELLRIMFPMVIFTGMAFTLVGLLQSLGEFKIPAVMSLVSNAVCIIYLLTLNNIWGIYGLAAALLVGWVLQFLMLVYPAYKKGYRYDIKAGLRDSGLRDVIKLALPVLFASWVQPINTTVNTALASGMEGGGVSALNYANRLYIIAASVFAVSLTNYIYPKLSRAWVAENMEEWTGTLVKSIKMVLLIVIPIALVFLIQSQDIIRIVYKRGEFKEADVLVTASVMFFYSLGMLWYGLQEIFNKAFYSSLDSKTPMVIAVGGIVTNVVFCFLLSKAMGITGLALSASLSAFIWCVVSFVRLRAKTGRIKASQLQPLRILLMAAGMGISIYLLRGVMLKAVGTDSFISSVITFAVPAAAGAAVYVMMAFILKLEEVKVITDKFRRGKENV